MFKKFTFILLTIILLGALSFWSPWSKWNFSLLETLGLSQQDDFAGLQVYSISGEIEVSLDDEVVGNVTVEGSPLEVFEIEPGEHVLTIKRVLSGDNAETTYYEYNRIINFLEGVNTVAAYELGPTREFSDGYLIYATPAVNADTSMLNIISNPQNTIISINNEEVSKAPLNNYPLDFGSDYTVAITLEGYETIDFQLLPEDEAQRKLLENYDLNVEVDLFRIPLETINNV